jgi:hypothetical protein
MKRIVSFKFDHQGLYRFFKPRLSLVLFFAFAVVTSFAVEAAGFAQVSTGSVSGRLVDQQGGSVPGASIRLTNRDTNAEVTTTSDKDGLFRITLLPVGMYRLELAKAGFAKAVLASVDVTLGADHGLGAIELKIGDLQSTVEVTSALPLLETSEAQVTNAFSFTSVATFSGVLENQGLDNLALTVPGVTSTRDAGFSNTNGVGFSVNGIRGRNNDQQIDGQNNNDNSVGGPGLFVSDPHFLGEYQIITNNFGPEYGRNSGSVVNISTKSGGNTVHGEVYGTESNSKLNTLSNTQKAFEGLGKVPRFNDEFTGGTIGGPLWKDHVFFFGGFDNEIVSQQQVFATGLLTPTPAGIATLIACYQNIDSSGDTSGPKDSVLALQAFGPYGVKGGNPTQQGTATLQQATNCADGISRDVELNGIQRTLATGSKSYNFPIKLDIQTAKNRFYGRYLFNKSTFFNTDSFGTAAAGYPVNVPALSQAYGFSWVRTLSARMSNEFRVNYGRLSVEFGGNAIGNTVPNQGNIAEALAQVTFSDQTLLPFGPATNSPQGRIVNTYQLQDNWNYFRGRHGLKAGVNFTYQRSPNSFLPNLNGAFRFADFRALGNNTPNRVRIASGDPSLDFREKDTFVYFGDDFRIKKNLTINLGIDWSYYGQPANLFHDRTVASQTGSNPLFDPQLPLAVTTFPSIPAPKNSWAPAAGFAWTPGFGGLLTGNGKTVIRGGYRLAYDPPFYNIYLNISSSAPVALLNSLTGSTAAGLPLPAAPFGPTVRKELAASLQTGVFDPRAFNETSLPPDFGPQRTHEWTLGIQREILGASVFEARYVGNHATKLFQSVNGNPDISGLAAAFPELIPAGETPCPASQAVVPVAAGRVNCNLGVVRLRRNSGFSDYNGLQLEFRSSQLWHQLALRTSYTFSKTTDNADDIFGTGLGSAFSQSQVNFRGSEHGLSALDVPHSWSLTFYEQIPAFRSQHGVFGHILGGWALSGTYFITSGQPYTASQFALNGGSFYDNAFTAAFIGTVDQSLRPFAANPGAPVSTVGIFAADVCGSACPVGIAPTTLVSLNQFNASGDVVAVTDKDVRFIANSPTANQVFHSPFGNVARNSLRDAKTNTGNFSVYKTFKVKERLTVQWHLTMLNVFNHPNFATVDPFIDDAGLKQEFTGFADPTLQNGGFRSIRFGLTFKF